MFKNIFTIIVVSAMAATAFAKGGEKVVDIRAKESTHADKATASQKVLVDNMLKEAITSKDLVQKELAERLGSLKDTLARVKPETLRVLTIDSLKAVEANKILAAGVFADSQGQKAAAAMLQTLAYTKGIRPAADLIELAKEYKGTDAFEAWVTVEREIARASKDGSYQSDLDGIANARHILRGGDTSRIIRFNDLIETEKQIVKQLRDELKNKNGCLALKAA